MVFKNFGVFYMQRLGKILHTVKGNLIARAEKRMPKLGARVYGDQNKLIGKVSDIFGPISAPYIAIKPASNISPRDITELVNKEMYIEGG